MSTEQTWTFVGHWENDRIVVEYVLDGDQQDDREDDGEWEQGLFAASASGATMQEAEAKVRAEYEEDFEDDEEEPAPPAFAADINPHTNEVLVRWGGEDLLAVLASVDDGSHSLGYWHPVTGEWLVLIEDMDSLMRDRLNPDIRKF